MAILQYDFKTVASREGRKVKAGRLLVQKQLVTLGGSFCSALPASTTVNRIDDSDTTSSFCPYYTALSQMKKSSGINIVM
jgi:hypothetical protein